MAAVAFVLLAASAAVGGCGSQGASATGAEAAQGGQGYVAGDGSTVVLPIAERKAAPALNGTTLTGQPWSLADQRGHVTVANIWASWCAPCRAEAPTLQRTFAKFEPQGVRFVGLDTRDSITAGQAFVDKYGITYPNLSDPDGQLQLAFRDTLPPAAIPSTVFIDKQGRVAARVLGRIDDGRLNGIIETLAAEPG
ncbi:MAG: hypothetical protein QG597_1443 [Actinomycetota bacterium]|nr:hypothetical protein [Actinomycetota bacterium]